MKVVDGGYLSWCYGTTAQTVNGWSGSARLQFTARQGVLIVLDSDTSERTKFDPEYKSRRREKKAENPERQEKADHVRYLVRDVIMEDPLLSTVIYPGLEADDLVALIAVRRLTGQPCPLKVIGADKDLLQIDPLLMTLERISGEVGSIEKFSRRLPKAVQPYIRAPRDVLLTLALMGDKSDSVPRLIPPYHLEQFINIMKNPGEAYYIARERFGQAFLKNLYLTVLPGPWCFEPVPTPEKVFELCATDSWGTLPCKVPLLAKITTAVLDVRSREVRSLVSEEDW